MTGPAALLSLLLQAAIAVAVLESVRRRHVPALVNGLVVLVAALTPTALHAGLQAGDAAGWPVLSVWIGAAGLVHAVGMLGLYDRVWWWDHAAHFLSAALVTALTYAAVLVADRNGGFVLASTVGVIGVTLGYLLLFGAFWELLELLARHVADRVGAGPMLVIYGPTDTAFDLVFNVVGAGLVLLLDVRVFVPVFAPNPGATAELLLGVGGSVGVGSLLIGLWLVWADDEVP